MKNFLVKNWKTTLAGLSILVLVGLYILKEIDTTQLLTIIGILTGIGFIGAKDGDKTGVSTFTDDIAGGGHHNPPPKEDEEDN